jgi:hypothetical protein
MEEKNPQIAFEVVVSKVKEGVTMSDLIKADKVMEDSFLVKQKGFLKREVALSKDKAQLFVIVHWATLEDAEAAGAAFYTNPDAMKRMGLAEVVLYNHYVTGLARWSGRRDVRSRQVAPEAPEKARRLSTGS